MSDREATGKVLRCYRCGESLEALSLPLSRLDLCPGCGVELHVCRMCVNYAPSAPDACLEEDAPEFRTKTAANFCDYFRPSPEAFDGSEKRAEDQARTQLDALFGSDASDAPETSGKSGADVALQQAEDLFK
jgi:hypothetical protein